MNMIRAVRRRFTVGHLATAKDPATLRHAAAELLATAIFVFAAEGATLSLGRMHHHDKGGGGLVAVALAHALALAAAVGCAANISGGHVNPAVTFGAAARRRRRRARAQARHRRDASAGVRAGGGRERMERGGAGGGHGVRAHVRLLCDGDGQSAEGPRRRRSAGGAARRGASGGGQRAGLRRAGGRRDESGARVRARRRGLPSLETPMGVLGGAHGRRRPLRRRLRAPRRRPGRRGGGARAELRRPPSCVED
uniref:Aquaporin TIP3.1 n=1 Tax=Zea mays TaxID=4577 RepID=A0A804RC56_MAIZE